MFLHNMKSTDKKIHYDSYNISHCLKENRLHEEKS